MTATAALALAGCASAPPEAPKAALESPSAPVAQSADKYGPGKGESLATLGMQMTSATTSGDTTNSILAQIGGGYFLTPEHEVGGQLLVAYINPDVGNNSVFYFLTPYYNYNYRANPRLWYYGGPHMGFARVDAGGSNDNSFAYGLHAGARYWLSPTTSAFAEPRFTRYRASGSNTNDLTLLLGLAVTF